MGKLHCSLAGNLGADCGVKYSQKGTCIVSFTLASKRGWGDNEKTEWVKCSLFGKRGERLQEYLVKGTPVTVWGELGLGRWTTADGEERAMLEMDVGDIQLQGHVQLQRHDSSLSENDVKGKTPF